MSEGIAIDPQIDLSSMLDSDDPLDRVDALELIGEGRHADAFPRVLKALRDENSMVRLAAAEALAVFDLEESRQELRAYVAWEKDPLAAGYGLSTLGLIADMSDVPRLLCELEQATSPQKRIHAAVALVTAASRVSGKVLAAQLSAPEPELRHLAAGGLLAALQYVSPEVGRVLGKRLLEESDAGVREKLDMIMELLDGS